jgi:hypothetical protein
MQGDQLRIDPQLSRLLELFIEFVESRLPGRAFAPGAPFLPFFFFLPPPSPPSSKLTPLPTPPPPLPL